MITFTVETRGADHCLHVWQYYNMKLSRCRKQRRKCPRIEEKEAHYSLRAWGIL